MDLLPDFARPPVASPHVPTFSKPKRATEGSGRVHRRTPGPCSPRDENVGVTVGNLRPVATPPVDVPFFDPPHRKRQSPVVSTRVSSDGSCPGELAARCESATAAVGRLRERVATLQAALAVSEKARLEAEATVQQMAGQLQEKTAEIEALRSSAAARDSAASHRKQPGTHM